MSEPEKIFDQWQQDFKIKIKQDLRAQAAIAAMQGWLARCATVSHGIRLNPGDVAQVSVQMADALLKELEK